MKTALSVNLNKVALVRNSREGRIPDVVQIASLCIDAGCHGITVHPRPDQRHVRPEDVRRLAAFLREYNASHKGEEEVEYNIEGNPFAGPESNGYPGFMALIKEVVPDQVTLVPDSPDQLTSDHGFRLEHTDRERLAAVIKECVTLGCRVSLFVDDDIPLDELREMARMGVGRVELYTGPYAEAHLEGDAAQSLERYAGVAKRAKEAGLELNAGHDLSLDNLAEFLEHVRGVREVSIGHALIHDALRIGYPEAVRRYLEEIDRAG